MDNHQEKGDICASRHLFIRLPPCLPLCLPHLPWLSESEQHNAATPPNISGPLEAAASLISVALEQISPSRDGCSWTCKASGTSFVGDHYLARERGREERRANPFPE